MRYLFLLVAAIMMIAAAAEAAPKARLIDNYWTRTGDGRVEHTAWALFLSDWVREADDDINRVAYGEIDAAGLRALTGYLEKLQNIDPVTLTRDEQFAYWVNLYNAATVALVADNFPVASIREIGGRLLSPGPWNDSAVTVAGRKLSLNDIEHGILRPIWKDPRIHYAVNCASLGCPNLPARPFLAATHEAQLTAAARAYINHPRGVRFDNDKLIVSSIFKWYAVDFGRQDKQVIAHLRSHADPSLRQRLENVSRISRSEYDWKLNDHPS